jgi:hypothetical protein
MSARSFCVWPDAAHDRARYSLIKTEGRSFVHVRDPGDPIKERGRIAYGDRPPSGLPLAAGASGDLTAA